MTSSILGLVHSQYTLYLVPLEMASLAFGTQEWERSEVSGSSPLRVNL